MKIYRVWTESNHNIPYYLRHFLYKDAAEYWYKFLIDSGVISSSAGGPNNGIDEIDVDDRTASELEELRDD